MYIGTFSLENLAVDFLMNFIQIQYERYLSPVYYLRYQNNWRILMRFAPS